MSNEFDLSKMFDEPPLQPNGFSGLPIEANTVVSTGNIPKQTVTDKELKAQNSKAWIEWQEQCTQRKEWIADKQLEVTKRKAARSAAHKVFNEQWEAYVNEAQVEYEAAKTTAVPSRPALLNR